jgi:hypothetical protein
MTMSQGRFIVPPIYQDHSDQGRGYFQFSFHCPECDYSVMTNTQRSTTATATRVMDLGVGLIGGFWGRAAEQGEQMFGSRWEKEHDQALVKAWDEIKQDFRYCNKCKRTVCFRCWNPQINMCNNCAPDLKADAVQFQHNLNLEAQRQQIEQNYQAPQFNTSAVPSAVTPEMVMPPPGHSGPMPYMPPGQMAPQIPGGQAMASISPQAPSAASIAGFSTPGLPQQVACPSCNTPGLPGKFCQNCGTKLPMPDLFCPKCSTQVAATSHFCPECGERLAQ